MLQHVVAVIASDTSQADIAAGRRPSVTWHPDGSLLAVPGPYGEVQ